MRSNMSHVIAVLLLLPLLLEYIHCCSADGSRWVKLGWPGSSSQQCTCVRSRLCPAFLMLLQELRQRGLSTDGLRHFGCGFAGIEPLVCCNQVRICPSWKPVVPFDIRESRSNRVYRHQPWPHHGWPEPTTSSPEIVSEQRPEGCLLVPDNEHHGNRNLDPQDDPFSDIPITQSPDIDHTEKSSGVDGSTLLPTDLCGIAVEQRIIGGRTAFLGSHPWVARLGYTRSSSGDKLLFRCGAALFSSQYVITAAHCVSNLSASLTLAKIRLGELDERSDPDCIGDLCADPVQDFNPVHIAVHPQYNTPKYRNDIALIRLDRPVNFTAYIRPICLPLDSLRNKSYTGVQSTVAGWGATDLGKASSSPVLQQLSVTVVPNRMCARVFKERTDTELGPGQLCAGGERGQDSCEGDSGGPLMRPEQPTLDSVPRTFLIGIVSFGAKRCGSANLPGVYTHIGSYLDWILNTIRP